MEGANTLIYRLRLIQGSLSNEMDKQIVHLNDEAQRLVGNYKRTGDIKGLNEAIGMIEQAIGMTRPIYMTQEGYIYLAGMWDNLGAMLGRRFQRTGSMEDLNRAVELASMAVEPTPQDHRDRAGRVNNLGNMLGMRFQRTGSIEDLNRAIEVAVMAMEATHQDHPDRAAILNNLGSWLGRRFERTGSMDDLNYAVEVVGMGVEATPQDHPDRAHRSSNFGNWLGRRFERTGSVDDLNRAVEVTGMAVEAIPQDHPNRVILLSSLGAWLGKRFERTGSMDDLNRGVELASMAAEATPQDLPDRAYMWSNVGALLDLRFERTASMDDLNRAVEVAGMAVEATPRDYPGRARYLSNLVKSLSRRFQWTNSTDDLNRALSSCKEGWNCHSAPPSTRIHLARITAAILADQLNWEESSTFLEDAVKLLPTISPRSLKHTDKQHMLADFAGIASMAAGTALNAGKEAHHALKLLELGRGVIASLLLEMRTDVSELKQQHPELAKEFVSLRDELDSPTNTTALLTTLENTSSAESGAKRRREAEKRFLIVLEEIRSKQGFQNFLLPPILDELKTAADLGPIIVVNASPYRCDAFLVRQNSPVKALELPNLRLKDIEENTRSLRTADPYRVQQTLEWLWDVAASPILEALGFSQPPSNDKWPHIWWVLAGQLSQLPFHAAGRHSEGSNNTVLDRVISSYGSSIKALIYGRQHHGANPPQKSSENALLITVPGSGLPFALHEVAMLEKLCPLLKLNPVKPPPRRDEILAHLRACKIFHFASHGQSNSLEPSKSCLVLGAESDSITVADLRDCRLQENSPFLAYLSACSTKVNEAEGLVDEEIHLVSACQLAGFRHVVGTLWEVADEYCVDVARVLYETIKDEGMTDSAVYRGLHRAIRALRDKGVATTETKEESYKPGNAKINGDESSDGEAVIQQENDNQSYTKTPSVHDVLNAHNDATAALEGRGGHWTYQGKAVTAHGETITSKNRNDTVDASREQERSEEKPESGGDKPRQSNWGVPSGSPQLGGPLIWAAYIHAGL